MSLIFIDRPIMTWVLAILILLGGGVAATQLAIERFPDIAPPRVTVHASYPGASAETVERTVTAIIERELNGIPGLLSFSSRSMQGGSDISVLLNSGVDTRLAAIEVQNRVKKVEERLPESVRRQGVTVQQSSGSALLFVTLSADNQSLDSVQLGDLASSMVRPALLRVKGVGEVSLFSPEYAMRIWPDVHKLTAFDVTTGELMDAISVRNQRIPLGSIGAAPSPQDTALTAPLALEEDLNTPQDFGAIALKVNSDGSALRVSDVADVELGASNYDYPAFIDGRYCAAMSVRLAPGANALETTDGVAAVLKTLSTQLPPGVHFQTSFDNSTFVKLSIERVIYTLFEAMALVFLVMWLFMRSLRATLIPTMVVPIALAGTCAVIWAMGFSINVLTLFGLVLAIGILVDDAIVVVESVERIMREERLPAREATIKAMGQISGAITAITLVLTAVFIPMALLDGAVGTIYRQFSIALAVPMAFSAYLALTLTPALCAALLKPGAEVSAQRRTAKFGAALSRNYLRALNGILRRPLRYLVVYCALAAILAFLYIKLPSGFLPAEDEGLFAVVVQLPTGSPQAETRKVIDEVQQYLMVDPNVSSVFAMQGFSYFGGGQNAAMVLPSLTDWSVRTRPDQQIEGILARFNKDFEGGARAHPGALVKAFGPPPIFALGNTAGVELKLQDRAGLGHILLIEAKDRLLGLAAKSPVLAHASFSGQNDTSQIRVTIDRLKAESMGVGLSEINRTMETLYGSSYLGDFIHNNQVRNILVQAKGSDRQLPDSVLQARVRNKFGDMVPLEAFVSIRWDKGPSSIEHWNGFPSLSISAVPAPGYSTTQAMEEMARLISQLPIGFTYEWSGQSFQEQSSNRQMPLLFMLSILVVFLCLAGLYESWSTPLTVVLAIPMGVLGAVLAATARGLPSDLYFKVGLIAVIGLSAKNAILIVEVAQTLVKQGVDTHQALLSAARIRLRPIMMTSLAFMFGVLPLALAVGPGAASQHSMGTSVFGGMLSATALTLFVVPLLYSFIVRIRTRRFRRALSQKKTELA